MGEERKEKGMAWECLEMKRRLTEDNEIETSVRFRSRTRSPHSDRLEGAVHRILVELEALGDDVSVWKDTKPAGGDVERLLERLFQRQREIGKEKEVLRRELESRVAGLEHHLKLEKGGKETGRPHEPLEQREESQSLDNQENKAGSRTADVEKELGSLSDSMKDQRDNYRKQTMELGEKLAESEGEMEQMKERFEKLKLDERTPAEQRLEDIKKLQTESLEQQAALGEMKKALEEKKEEVKLKDQNLAEMKESAQAMTNVSELEVANQKRRMTEAIKKKDKELAKEKEKVRLLQEWLADAGSLGTGTAQAFLDLADEKAALLEERDCLKQQLVAILTELNRTDEASELLSSEGDEEVSEGDEEIEEMDDGDCALCCFHPDLGEVLGKVLKEASRPLRLRIKFSAMVPEEDCSVPAEALPGKGGDQPSTAPLRRSSSFELGKYAVLADSYGRVNMLDWLRDAESSLTGMSQDFTSLNFISGGLFPHLADINLDLKALIPRIHTIRQRLEMKERSATSTQASPASSTSDNPPTPGPCDSPLSESFYQTPPS